MKVLLLYTSYRQKEEIDLTASFLERTTACKTFDLLLYCNNMNIDIQDNFNRLPNPNKELIQKDTNKGGYLFGQMEVISDCYSKWQDYDYVIHLHPDIFITREDILLGYLRENLENDVVFIVNHPCRWPDSCGTDFFIMKPKLLSSNIFSLWNHPEYGKVTPLEAFFLKIIRSIDAKYIEIPRYTDNYYFPRRIDLNGLWHEHDLKKVKQFLADARNLVSLGLPPEANIS